MAVKLLPYNKWSASAKDLAQELGVKRLRDNTTWRPRVGRRSVIVNWGSVAAIDWSDKVRWINHPLSVKIAGNKLLSFRVLEQAGVSIPSFTDVYDKAKEMKADGKVIVARSVLRGHSGQGITIVERDDPLPDPSENGDKLWVEYVPKIAEYRVHVINGRVVDVQEKRKRSGTDAYSRIQNLANGWVFCREDIAPDPRRDDIAIAACRALNLDFGAVDVIFNRKRDSFFVLEVNTAPGLEGSTLNTYADGIKEMIYG